jgi:hypothetical protein
MTHIKPGTLQELREAIAQMKAISYLFKGRHEDDCASQEEHNEIRWGVSLLLDNVKDSVESATHYLEQNEFEHQKTISQVDEKRA